MYRTVAALAVALGAAVAPSLAVADPATKRRDPGRSPVSAGEFLAQAAAGNRFEIVTGWLAQDQAKSAEIGALSAAFVSDHTALLEQGAAVAARLGITGPGGLTPEQQRMVDRLQALSGSAFERAWILVQIKAHKEALRLHLLAAIRADRPDVRRLAQGALPVITHHFGAVLDIAGGRDSGAHADD
jgi:putative membrane protein